VYEWASTVAGLLRAEWVSRRSGLQGVRGILRGHLQPLVVPAYAEDGGEEPEVACVYLIDAAGVPRRLGMTPGNEFSDHRFEKRNYLYLAASKLRNCAIGPELVTDAEFNSLAGQVSIERAGETKWASPILSGDEAMSHSLANLEHHHFKYEAHRRPGDLHVHFLGADAFSFGQGVTLEDGDIMQVHFKALGARCGTRSGLIGRRSLVRGASITAGTCRPVAALST
jgi:hypothetical protein